MPNTSATGGPLAPAAMPAPLEGQALYEFVQAWLVGVCGLDGTMVRPRFQSEPPNIPDSGLAWMAFGIGARPADTFPFVQHNPGTEAPPVAGSSTLQRHETLDVLCSFYDTGVTGLADQYASILRDGLVMPQNSEVLQESGFALVKVGSLLPVPSLLKERWLYRIDFPLVVRRAIERTYPVLDVVAADGTINTDIAGVGPFPIRSQ